VILRGTAAARPAATTVAPGTLYFSTDTGTTARCADTGLTWEDYSDVGTSSSVPNTGLCQGRLTTETGVAISTSDRTAQSTIYFTPYLGNRVALYSGSAWAEFALTEKSLALSGLTSGKNYDVFLYNNSGTLTLELSAAWASDTARTDALTTQDGVYVKSGATTRRYVGTLRTTGTTTTEDSGGGTTTQVGGKRFVWNLYNPVARSLAVIDTTDTWAYATGTWRQANGATGNKVELVVGLAGDSLAADVLAYASMNNNSARSSSVAVGVDSITAPSGLRTAAFNASASTAQMAMFGMYRGVLAAGYHYFARLEFGADSGSTFIGDAGGTQVQTGLTATVQN
jgi:hypothetical protein